MLNMVYNKITNKYSNNKQIARGTEYQDLMSKILKKNCSQNFLDFFFFFFRKVQYSCCFPYNYKTIFPTFAKHKF